MVPIDPKQHRRSGIPVGKYPAGVAITPDSRTAYVANSSGGMVTSRSPISSASILE